MKIKEIEIEDKIYSVKVAETSDEYDDGLMNVENLNENEGMLFPFEDEDVREFWMKDTLIPLDIIFINSNNEVTKIIKGEPNSENIIHGQAKYVLELNADSGVNLGDEVEFDVENSEEDNTKMYVIGLDGNSQMTLEGGERIFSRKNTKTLIKFAKKAYNSNNDSDYKALGKRVFKFLNIQDTNEPEYVD